jgi:biuret amidohydrolase
MRGRIPWQAARPGRFAITDWEIEGRATALLLLDLQTTHLNPEAGVGPALWARFPRQAGYYYERIANQVQPTVLALQAFFREHELPIVYCLSGVELPDGRDVAPWSWRRAALSQASPAIPVLLPPGAPGRELWPALAPRPGELVLSKPTLSPFNSTALDQYLHNMHVENLVIGGVLSNGAVETTARAAGDRGYTAIVVEDACAAFSPEDHAACVGHASWYAVKSSDEVMQELEPLVADGASASIAT